MKINQKISTLLILVIIFIGIVILFLPQIKGSKTQPRKDEVPVFSPPVTPVLEEEFQREIYAFPAIVISKGEDYLIVKPLEKETLPYEEYQVFISPKTVIEKIVLVRDPKAPKVEKREKIDFSEIKENTILNLSVTENAGTHRELQAKEIIILISER